jgi:hypothetical protein
MIELLVEGKYRMDLPSNIEISVVDENPMFLEDRIPAPYSLDFEVPATLTNLTAFGFPTRITSHAVKRKATAELLFFGIVMGRGEVLLLENEKTLKLQFKGSLEHENVNKNINQLDLGEYNYGSVPNFYSNNPNNNYLNIDYLSPEYFNYCSSMFTNAVTGNDFVIAPVKIKGEDSWDGMENSGGSRNAFKQYINFFNPVHTKFYNGNGHDVHTPVLPFPYLWKVIQAGFGGQITTNPFATGDLSKLVMVSQNHKHYNIDTLLYNWIQSQPSPTTGISHESLLPLIENYSSYVNEELKVIIKSFQQAYSFKSFLKNLLKIFSMTAFPGYKYSLEFNNDIFDRNIVTKMDDKLAGDLLVTYDDAKDYKFMYSDYGESEEKVPDINNTSNILNIFSMMNYAYAHSDTRQDDSTKAIYSLQTILKGLNSQPQIISNIKRSALSIQKVSSNKGIYELNSEISPLDMNIHKYWWDNQNQTDIIEQKHWFVPEIDKKNLEASPHIMFYGGMAQNFEQNGQYPYLMAHHTDHFGVQRLNTSLHPEGSGGLIEKFHGKFKQWVEKDKKRVRGSFKLTPLEIKNLNIRDKIHLKGRLFYIEKKEYTLMNKGISLVDMELIEI